MTTKIRWTLAVGLAVLAMAPGHAKPVPAPVPALIEAAPPNAEAALSIIDAALAEGRLDAARDVIMRSAQRYDGPELRLRGAEIALAGGDLAQASIAFEDLVADPVAGARANQGLGLVRLRQGRLPEAVTALDAALAQDPKLVRAATARGVVADRQRDWARADTAYAQALASDPRSAAARNNHGYSLLLRGRLADAEAEFAAALAIDPKLATAKTNLRLARAMQGRYREAFASSSRETLAADLNTVGFAAMARGDFAMAETYFQRAMERNPQFDHVAWANLQYLQNRAHSPMDALDDSDPVPTKRR